MKLLLAIFGNFASEKCDRNSLTAGFPWQQIEPLMNKSYIFIMPISNLQEQKGISPII